MRDIKGVDMKLVLAMPVALSPGSLFTLHAFSPVQHTEESPGPKPRSSNQDLALG